MAFIAPLPLSASRATSRVSLRPQAPAPRVAPARRAAIASVATATVNDAELSSRALMLLSFLNCHKSIYLPGDGVPAIAAQLFRKNDTAHEYTPDDQIVTNADNLPGVESLRTLKASREPILAAGRASLASASLSATIADVLAAELDNILRVGSYGAAGGGLEFVHPRNTQMYSELMREMGVEFSVLENAVDAMVEASGVKADVAPYFAALLTAMKA